MKKPKYNPFKPVKLNKVHFNFDTDKDGVPDHKDCEPFNFWKQHKDPGDWLETKDPQPSVYGDGENKDWMVTTRYKRRPKQESGNLNDLEYDARKIYADWYDTEDALEYSVNAYVASFKGIYSSRKQLIKPNAIKVYMQREETIEAYDKKAKVYHFFDVTDPEQYSPNLIYSITAEDRRRIGERKLAKYLREL